ncbi:hypothetical protein A4D02_20050 [Niastella koreensis]|nr:hypothetical protein A4D02_20050 [Niastella koreensis]
MHVSRTNVEIGSDVNYTDTIVIYSNVDWKIDLSAGASAWLSVDPVKKGTGDSTVVTIKVTAATTTSSQTGTLTITPAASAAQPIQVNISRKIYSLVWQKCYGGSADDYCYETALLPSGSFITTGYSVSVDGDALGNAGVFMGWTLRAGSDGNKTWQKQMGGYGSVYQSVVASSDGGSVNAGYAMVANGPDDFSIVKFDANGNIVWNKTYGGSNDDLAYKIIATADGGYLVSGETESNDGDVKSNHGGWDIWVIRLDANGNLIWEKTFGGAGNEYWAKIAACTDGGYVLLSTTESNNTGDVQSNHGQNDFLVVKIDASGNKLWSKTYGGASFEYTSSVIGDADGGCILLGYTTSTNGDVMGKQGIDMDAWVVKLTKDGQIGWQAALGGSGSDAGFSLARLPDGHIAIAGNSDSKDRGITGNHGKLDVWVLVLDTTGKVVWQKLFGSSDGDGNSDIAVMADGSLLVTNTVFGSDGDVTGSHGGIDTWIFKLK